MKIETKHNTGDKFYRLMDERLYITIKIECPDCKGDYRKVIGEAIYKCDRCEEGKIYSEIFEDIYLLTDEVFEINEIKIRADRSPDGGFYIAYSGYNDSFEDDNSLKFNFVETIKEGKKRQKESIRSAIKGLTNRYGDSYKFSVPYIFRTKQYELVATEK